MKTTLNTYDIIDALRKNADAAWTGAGARALAEYLEEYEESTGEELELDVCALRCDFSEFGSLVEWADEYFNGDSWMDAVGLDKEEDHEDDDRDEAIRTYLQDHTTLIEFDGGIIVGCF